MGEPVLTAAGVWITIKSSFAALVAGILGAAVSLKFAPGLSVWEKITTVTTGAILAHFLSEPISDYFGIHNYHETIGFLVGLFGLSLCAAVLDLLKRLDVSTIISDIVGKYIGK